MRGWPQSRARRVTRCESTAVPGGDMRAPGTQGTAHAALPCTHTGPGRPAAHKRAPFPRAGELPGDGPERGREEARESARGGRVRGRTSRSARARACCETVISCYPGNGLAPAPRAARHGRTDHTSRPQARSSAGQARTPAPHGLAARGRHIAGSRVEPGNWLEESSAPGLDPGPRDAGRDIACLPDPHSRRDQDTRRRASSRCRSLRAKSAQATKEHLTHSLRSLRELPFCR